MSSAGTRTTWNLHPDNVGGLGFESESSTASPTPMNRHYLSVGGTAIGVLVSRGALPPLAAGQMAPTTLTSVTLIKVEYWHKDHLGSLIATTDHAGAVTARYSYDPFGKRRQANGTYDSFGTLVVDWTTDTNKGTDRGYTGHEHLDDIGVIHMNGRVFDPTLGRFMQGDPLVQDPGNLQNYDRYGYCYNNPLTCSDPSGYSFLDSLFKASFQAIRWGDPAFYYPNHWGARTQWGYTIGSIAIAAAASYWCGMYGGPNAAAGCVAAGETAWAGFAGKSAEESLKIGTISYLTASAFNQVGDWTTTANPDVPGEFLARTDGQQFANVAGHSAVGCASAAASGGSCEGGAVGAGLSAAWSSANYGPSFSGGTARVMGLVSSSLIGGLGSVAGGGTFADGAKQAAFGYIFNDLQHMLEGTAADRAIVADLAAKFPGLDIRGQVRSYFPFSDNYGIVDLVVKALDGYDYYFEIKKYTYEYARSPSRYMEAVNQLSGYVSNTENAKVGSWSTSFGGMTYGNVFLGVTFSTGRQFSFGIVYYPDSFLPRSGLIFYNTYGGGMPSGVPMCIEFGKKKC